MVSSRIPIYVKEYAEKNKISVTELILKGFDSYRATDIDHAISRLEYHEKRVLHWRHIVLQQDEECNTKVHICNTLRKTFVEQGRGSKESYHMDMSWITAKTEQLVDEGIIITPRELYDFCIKKEDK